MDKQTQPMRIFRMTGINRANNQPETVNVSAYNLDQAFQLFGMTHRRMASTGSKWGEPW